MKLIKLVFVIKGNITFGNTKITVMRIVLMSFLLSFSFFVQGQDTTVQKKDIISSTKLFDLNFTTKEIDTLYSDVIDNIANYKAMHQLNLPNSVPLSLWQTPVVAGMHFNK